jgi:hypothetical protein
VSEGNRHLGNSDQGLDEDGSLGRHGSSLSLLHLGLFTGKGIRQPANALSQGEKLSLGIGPYGDGRIVDSGHRPEVDRLLFRRSAANLESRNLRGMRTAARQKLHGVIG